MSTHKPVCTWLEVAVLVLLGLLIIYLAGTYGGAQ
jgi:hypothetical protein